MCVGNREKRGQASNVKIGSEDKKAFRLMIALLATAALVGIYDFAYFGTSSAAPPTTTTTSPTQKKSASQMSGISLDAEIRFDLLAISQNRKYEPGRNIFKMEERPIPTPEPVMPKPQNTGAVKQEATPTPTPPIPLKFYGFASKPNEPKRIFLSDSDQPYVAKQGDIVERKYMVIEINKTSVVIEDMLHSNRQTIPLTAK